MDSLLIVGELDRKLQKFLGKVGYAIAAFSHEEPLGELTHRQHFDLIVLDTRADVDYLTMCEFLRANDSTREVPILMLASEARQRKEVAERGIDRIEFVDAAASVGALASQIATQVRLRKMAGKDEQRATLGEINARLRDLNSRFTKELEDARALQQSLVPGSLPNDERFEIAVSYEPLEEVGGDWYYVKPTEGGDVLCLVADVTGHGLSAAFICSMTKLAMTAAGREAPGDLLREMNRLLEPNLPPGTFVTMFAWLYNPNSGSLRYARAGHPPALLLNRKAESVTQLRGDGFAVGFFDDSEYEEHEERLGIGDVAMMYTDALPESQNLSGQTYDYERMQAVLRRSAPSLSARQHLVAVLDDFDDFRQERILKDDVTVVVLKRVK